MKFLIFGHHPYLYTGLGKVGFTLAKSLLKLKHTWNYIAVAGEEKGAAIIEDNKVIPFSMIKNSLQNLTKDVDYIITIGDLWMFPEVYDLVTHTGIKWIAYFGCEGTSYPTEATTSRTVKILLHGMMEAISEIWTYTTESEKILKKLHGDVKILPHCIDHELIKKSTAYPLRKILSMPPGKKLAVFVGDNIYRKGIDLILKWLAKEREWIAYLHTPSFKSVGCNIDDLKKVYNLEGKLFTKADLEAQIGTIELLSETVYGIMKAADLYLHPHRAEGFGLTVLEALCCKIPVLATDTAGPSTYLPKGCKIPVESERYYQMGGVGYLMEEPDFNEMVKLINKGKGRHDFQKTGFVIGDFVMNLQKLLMSEKKNRYWMRII